MNESELKDFLDQKVVEFNQKSFIASDPIQVPHYFSKKEDIEIAGFLTATIAWGTRKTIISNAHKMMQLMDNSPFDFVLNHSNSDLNSFSSFKHRTFNGVDFKYFVSALKHIYLNHNGLETVFHKYKSENSLQPAIHQFRKLFFELNYPKRTQKHLADPMKKSAAKRINMFLRWMVRKDNSEVDFGIWKSISPAILSCPLDVHSGNVARKLGLLKRNQNDSKAVEELDKNLRIFDPSDPVKYDFALFGLGVFEKF